MKTGRGKRVALVTFAVGIVVLAAAGYAFRERILEEYWLYRLEHGDRRAKEASATALGTMRSLRAVGPLLREIHRDHREGILVRHKPILFTPIVAALHAVGPSARGLVVEAMHIYAVERRSGATIRILDDVILAWDTPGCEVRAVSTQEFEAAKNVSEWRTSLGGIPF